ncbi:hypothetical protein [Pseudomonas kitaguniensis]|uniref:hypothetical protein n=1 Tax=Pseudomonas kitaguniensis TaxID=2607908 RepID=UPI003BA150E4
MLFEFLNIDATARALIATSPTFINKYAEHDDAVAFLKKQAVALYQKFYAAAEAAEDVADGVLQVPVWKDVGVTFCAVQEPNRPRGEDFAVSFETPGALYIEVNFWTSLS